jgi:hypothetical protein
VAVAVEKAFNPSEPRDRSGEWTSGLAAGEQPKSPKALLAMHDAILYNPDRNKALDLLAARRHVRRQQAGLTSLAQSIGDSVSASSIDPQYRSMIIKHIKWAQDGLSDSAADIADQDFESAKQPQESALMALHFAIDFFTLLKRLKDDVASGEIDAEDAAPQIKTFLHDNEYRFEWPKDLSKADFNPSEPRDRYGEWTDGLVTASHSPIIQADAEGAGTQPLTGQSGRAAPLPKPGKPGTAGGKGATARRRGKSRPTTDATAYWGGKPKHFATEGAEEPQAAPLAGASPDAATRPPVAQQRASEPHGDLHPAGYPASYGLPPGTPPPKPPMSDGELDRAIGLKPKPSGSVDLPTDVVNTYSAVGQGEPVSRKWHESMPDLIADIKQHGIKEPVHLLVSGGRAILYDGQHRVLAAKKLGLESVPTTVEQVDANDPRWYHPQWYYPTFPIKPEHADLLSGKKPATGSASAASPEPESETTGSRRAREMALKGEAEGLQSVYRPKDGDAPLIVYHGSKSSGDPQGFVWISRSPIVAENFGEVKSYRVKPGAKIYPDYNGMATTREPGLDQLLEKDPYDSSAIIHASDLEPHEDRPALNTSPPPEIAGRKFTPSEIEAGIKAFRETWPVASARPESLLVQRAMNIDAGRDPDAGMKASYGNAYDSLMNAKDAVTEVGHRLKLTPEQERDFFAEVGRQEARRDRAAFAKVYGEKANLYRGLSPKEIAAYASLRPGDSVPMDRPLLSTAPEMDYAAHYARTEPGEDPMFPRERATKPGDIAEHIAQYQNVGPEDVFSYLPESEVDPDNAQSAAGTPGYMDEVALHANRRPWKFVGTRDTTFKTDDPSGEGHKAGDKRRIYVFEPGVPEPWRDDSYTKSGKVEQVPTDWLMAHAGNPVDHDKVASLKSDMERNGLREPVIIGFDEKAGKGSGYVIEGNHRVAAAHALGWTHVPARANRMRMDGRPAAKPLKLNVKPDEYNYIPADLAPSQAIDFGNTPAPEPPAPIDANAVGPDLGMLAAEYSKGVKLPKGKIAGMFTTKSGQRMAIVRRDLRGNLASSGDVVLSAHPINPDGSIGQDVGFIALEGDFDSADMDQSPGKAAVSIMRTNSKWQHQGVASKLADTMHAMYPKGVDYGAFTQQGRAWHEAYLARMHDRPGGVLGQGATGVASLVKPFDGNPEHPDVLEGALMAYNKGSKRSALEVLKDNPDFAHQVAQTQYHTNALASGAAALLSDVTAQRWTTRAGENGMIRVRPAPQASTLIPTNTAA